ncbi:MAG: YkgJ family cysteine cluster protein [Candidatus Latescibacterota bacterium]
MTPRLPGDPKQIHELSGKLTEEQIHLALGELYQSIPGTTCANCGSCCRVNEVERRQGWVTMYPLYAAEYLHIASFVADTFAPQRRDFLLSFQEEWPLQCPFRDPEQDACTIYPVRPLTCRTYGIMDKERIEETVAAHQSHLQREQLERFKRSEMHHLCPNVKVAEPAKFGTYAAHRIACGYTRKLEILSVEAGLMGRARRQVFETITGITGILSWTWGGFNALRGSSMGTFIEEFPDYWAKADLAR